MDRTVGRGPRSTTSGWRAHWTDGCSACCAAIWSWPSMRDSIRGSRCCTTPRFRHRRQARWRGRHAQRRQSLARGSASWGPTASTPSFVRWPSVPRRRICASRLPHRGVHLYRSRPSPTARRSIRDHRFAQPCGRRLWPPQRPDRGLRRAPDTRARTSRRPAGPKSAPPTRYGLAGARPTRALPPPGALYYDQVAQIDMPRWSAGHVVLVGDACQAVSLLAGQGASLALAGARVLADELAGDSDLPQHSVATTPAGPGGRHQAGSRSAHGRVVPA